MSGPFYNLRPNKHIDRNLFASALSRAVRFFDIQNYCYVGMGSFHFDDFRLIHESIGLSDMISIEKDSMVVKRAYFNRPYNCIKIENTAIGDYISDLNLDDDDRGFVFWLDYCYTKELSYQLNEFATLLGKLRHGDIVRITLPADLESIKPLSSIIQDSPEYCQASHDDRTRIVKEARERVVDSRIPHNILPDDQPLVEYMNAKQYPLLLLAVLRNISLNISSPVVLIPMFSTIYQDTTRMLTATGLIVDKGKWELDQIKEFKNCFSGLNYMNFNWLIPAAIKVPQLTEKEFIAISENLPLKRRKRIIEKKYRFAFSDRNIDFTEEIESLERYYSAYPHFHSVNF